MVECDLAQDPFEPRERVRPVSCLPEGSRVVVLRHLTDQLEFYQLPDYTGDVDLRAKPAVREEFHNVHRPHAGLKGLTPHEAPRAKLLS